MNFGSDGTATSKNFFFFFLEGSGAKGSVPHCLHKTKNGPKVAAPTAGFSLTNAVTRGCGLRGGVQSASEQSAARLGQARRSRGGLVRSLAGRLRARAVLRGVDFVHLGGLTLILVQL